MKNYYILHNGNSKRNNYYRSGSLGVSYEDTTIIETLDQAQNLAKDFKLKIIEVKVILKQIKDYTVEKEFISKYRKENPIKYI